MIIFDRYVGHVVDNMHVPGTGRIWLDDVLCYDSYYTDLSVCYHSEWGVHNCNHDKDVYIACYNTMPTTHPSGKNIHVRFKW